MPAARRRRVNGVWRMPENYVLSYLDKIACSLIFKELE